MKEKLFRYYYDVRQLLDLDMLDLDKLEEFSKLLIEVRKNNGRVFVFGNGGSASTAVHFTTDLYKVLKMDAACLNTNVSLMTALSNDLGYENVFTEQLVNSLKPYDLVVAFSTSGVSPNIVNAIKYANGNLANTVLFTGIWGSGELDDFTDIMIKVPSISIRRIEDIHLILCHSFIETVCERICR